MDDQPPIADGCQISKAIEALPLQREKRTAQQMEEAFDCAVRAARPGSPEMAGLFACHSSHQGWGRLGLPLWPETTHAAYEAKLTTACLLDCMKSSTVRVQGGNFTPASAIWLARLRARLCCCMSLLLLGSTGVHWDGLYTR